jgi:adenine/guanine phosphoribosyltransferase-like PRPP-binding protein
MLLSPESSGFFLAHALGKCLGAEDVAVAKIDVRRRPRTSLRVGQIVPGRPVVIVNDVVTSGASLEPLLAIAAEAGAPVAGVLVFGTLSDTRFKQFLNRHDLAATWLVSAVWQTHAPGGATCPQCAAGEELMPVAELS